MQRPDDFSERRKHLAHFTDEQLLAHFWQLTCQVVDPLIDLAKKHTSPSIERSVLLRMGFSSLEAQPIVKIGVERGLLGKGLGHLVWRLAQLKNIEIREAGLLLAGGNGWDELESYFAAKGGA